MKMGTLAVFVLLCLFGVLLTSAAYAGKPIDIDRKLLEAMKDVESGGDECEIGDGGKALGPYQIWEHYYNDAVEFNPSLRDNGRTYKSVVGIGSSEYSEEVIRSYMGRYATPQRLGREPTNEDIARIHNGGPNGYKKDATLPYWNKVRSHMSDGSNKRDASGNVCSPACNAGECCNSRGVCNCLTEYRNFEPCMRSSGGSKVVIGMAVVVVSTTPGLFFNMGHS